MVDYSKFEHITESDDENVEPTVNQKQSAPKSVPAPGIACANCNTACAKPLFCGKCKTSAYCGAACQKQDWRFHKRICKEPVSMEQNLQQKFPGSFCLGGSGLQKQPLLQSSKVHGSPPQVVETSRAVTTQQANNRELLHHSQVKQTLVEPGKLSEHDLQVNKNSEADSQQTKDCTGVAYPSASGRSAEVNESDRDKAASIPQTCTKDDPVDTTVHQTATSDISHGVRCTNCTRRCAKPLQCSVCKEATYCSPLCQKEDWRLHKSVCKKAKPKVFCKNSNCGAVIKDGVMFCNVCGARRPDEEAVTRPSEPLRPKTTEAEKVDEKEEVGDWYRHREWQPAEKQSFSPQRIDAEPAEVEQEKTPGLDQPGPEKSQDMLPWWTQRLTSLKIKCADSESPMKVEVERVTEITGSASMLQGDGNTRLLFDLRFRVCFDVEAEETSSSGFVMQTSSCGFVHVSDFSNARGADFSMKAEGPDLAVRVAEAELFPKLKTALLECIQDYGKQR